MIKKLLLLSLAATFSGTALADNHMQPPTVYGQYYAIAVSDPAAVVAAMTTYRESDTGKKLTSNLTLSANVANGTDRATHTISVFYPSAAAMEADMAASRGSSDWATFTRAMRGVATIEAENVFTQTRGRVNDDALGGPGVATMLFGITVLDAGRYGAALDKIMNSTAAAAFPGNMSAGQIIAMGEDPGTHWVSFQAKDMGTLLSGVETFMNSNDFANYAKGAREFRRVEGRYVSRAVLSFGSQ